MPNYKVVYRIRPSYPSDESEVFSELNFPEKDYILATKRAKTFGIIIHNQFPPGTDIVLEGGVNI